jgi:hypothetical protein
MISIESQSLAAESRCQEKGIFSVKKNYLTKELSDALATLTISRYRIPRSGLVRRSYEKFRITRS